MFLGILIGLMFWGAFMVTVNWDVAANEGADIRIIGALAFFLGLGGSIGWLIEVAL